MSLNIQAPDPGSDLQHTRHVYKEVSLGRFALAFQPVVAAQTPESVLFHEGLLRYLGPSLDFNVFAVLERQQAIGLLDRCVVNSVISVLQRHPKLRLACNISAQSTRVDGTWDAIWERLADMPEVATRLVLEITESSQPPDVAQAIDFIAKLKQLRCAVAIDDFGVGFATLEFVRTVRPDILKIDRGYLHRARQMPDSAQAFVHLLKLCQALAPCVVVEGVENEDDHQRAVHAGAQWLQGFRFGAPQLRSAAGSCPVRLIRP